MNKIWCFVCGKTVSLGDTCKVPYKGKKLHACKSHPGVVDLFLLTKTRKRLSEEIGHGKNTRQPLGLIK